LNPDALAPPRAINPHISPATERAILAAIAMHPSQRPPTVTAFREMLHTGSLPSTLLTLVPAEGEWQRAVTENRGLLVLAGIMLALAVLATSL